MNSDKDAVGTDRSENPCPDCGYEATDRVDAYVHVISDHNGDLSNV